MPTLFPFQPTGLTEVIRFATDVRMTPDGEFRDSLKDGDYILREQFAFPPDVAARAEGLIRSNPAEIFYAPLWQDVTPVLSDILSGATSIPVNTDSDYRAGGFAAIISDDQFAEVVSVTSASGGTLTCSATSQSYSGSESRPIFVAPVVEARLPFGLARSDEVGIVRCDLEFICPDPADLSATVFPQHRTYDVVTDSSVVFEPLGGSISQKLEAVTNVFGHIDLEDIEEYVRHRGTITAFDTTQPKRFARRQWIHQIRGQDRPFWLPTWQDDLRLRSAVGSAATTARVQRITPVEADMVGRSVQFLLEDGTAIHREITAAAAVGGDPTSIDIDIAAPGQDVPASAIASLMNFVRLDTDEIEIVHTPGNASIHSAFSAPVVETPFVTQSPVP